MFSTIQQQQQQQITHILCLQNSSVPCAHYIKVKKCHRRWRLLVLLHMLLQNLRSMQPTHVKGCRNSRWSLSNTTHKLHKTTYNDSSPSTHRQNSLVRFIALLKVKKYHYQWIQRLLFLSQRILQDCSRGEIMNSISVANTRALLLLNAGGRGHERTSPF